MKYLIYILIIFLILNISFINCSVLKFIKTQGEWSNDLNWDLGRIPNINDTSILQENQIVYNLISSIESNEIYIGYENPPYSNSILNANYGILASKVFIMPNCTLFVTNNKANPFTKQEFQFNITNLNNYGSLMIYNSSYYSIYSIIENQFSNDVYQESELYIGAIFSFYSKTLISSSIFINSILQIESGSIFEFYNSEVLINDILYTPPKLLLLSSSNVAFYNSNLTIQSVIGVFDEGSKLLFSESNVNIIDNSTSIYVGDAQFLIYSCNQFVSDKEITTGGIKGTALEISNSNITLNSGFISQGDAFLSIKNSILQSNGNFFMADSSSALISNLQGSFNNFGLMGGASCFFYNGNISFYQNQNPFLSLSLANTSTLLFNRSIVNIETNIVTTGSSIFVGLNSNISIGEGAFFFKTSIIEMNNTNLQIDATLQMTNYSVFYSYESTLIVSDYIYFTDYSYFVLVNCSLVINGHFLDQSKRFMYDGVVSFISNSNIVIKGFYYNEGSSYFYNSKIQVFGLLYNGFDSGFRFMDSQVEVNSSFINNYYIELENSNLVVTNGSIFSNSSTYFISKNSKIDINDGEFIIGYNSNITLLNTTLNNLRGKLETNGDIFINENGILTNNANFLLSSNILLKSSSGNGNEIFLNSGTLNINGSSNSNKESNILINFVNQNGTVNIFKDTVIQMLNQDNSNFNFKNDSSSVTIKENLNSINDSFTFTIGLNKSSEINVLQNATIQNPNIIIRISTELLNTNDYNNNIQINKTLVSSNLITNSNSTTNSQKNVIFKSYDPSTNQENELNSCKHKVVISETSIKLLLNSQDECSGNGSSKLTKGQIIGIVFGIIGFVAVVSCFIYYKTKLPKSQQLKYRLKKMNEKPQQ